MGKRLAFVSLGFWGTAEHSPTHSKCSAHRLVKSVLESAVPRVWATEWGCRACRSRRSPTTSILELLPCIFGLFSNHKENRHHGSDFSFQEQTVEADVAKLSSLTVRVSEKNQPTLPVFMRSPSQGFLTLLRDLSLHSIHTPTSWEIRLAIGNFPSFHTGPREKSHCQLIRHAC